MFYSLFLHLDIFYLFCCPNHQDALLERYFCKGTFSDLKQQDIGRPIKSLIVRSQSTIWTKLAILFYCNLYSNFVLQTGCHFMDMRPHLWYRGILSMVFFPILVGRHCMFCNLLGRCYNCYASSHPIFRVEPFYSTCQ